MSNSMFCPNCGMLKSNCICNHKSSVENEGSPNLFSFSKPQTTSILDDEIQESYSIEDHKMQVNRFLELKELYPNIDEDIIENFPFYEPRFGQFEIIQNIEDAINQGYKYIILEAGTGTGKSAIATTLAKMYGSAYILTMTKQLQSQYNNEFEFPLVKGRSNFTCLHDGLEVTCDMGACKTSPTSSNFFCEFGVAKNPTLDAELAFEDSFGGAVFYQSPNWEQKANSINSPITLMNYDYAIAELNYVKHFGTRSLLILDEAHNIESKLMNTMEVNIYNNRLEKDISRVISKETLKDGELQDWLMEISAIGESYEDIEIKDLSKNKADRIRSTISRLKTLKKNLESEPENWVIDSDENGVSFKPLRVHHYAKDSLLKYGDVVIFMSATILSSNLFAKWLGLSPDEVYHIKVDSPFTKEKRPIILNLAGKMSKNRIGRTAPKTIPILKEILNKHKDEKGLIHTNSYKCQHFINNNLINSRLISHNSDNRERILDYFEKDENPLVLVSPSMSEGVDLPYDKCRFQVIYKIPFPYLGDKQINMRRKKDQKWYAYKTVMTLMQAYGRGMRAEDDYCYTYILDSDINMVLKSPIYRSLVPDFFREAVVRVKK